MKQILSATKRTAGFTLIELLVVIGILGILAAALVATIDPFEQLKKANDANVENTEIEFLNAVIRYYTTNSAFPWDYTSIGGADCIAAGSAAVPSVDLPYTLLSTWLDAGGNATDCLDTLISSGELKPSFDSAGSILSEIYVGETGTTTTACYNPQSKAKTENVETRFIISASAPYTFTADNSNACTANGGSTDCYRCTQG